MLLLCLLLAWLARLGGRVGTSKGYEYTSIYGQDAVRCDAVRGGAMRCDAMRSRSKGLGIESKLRQIIGVSRISLLHLNKVGGSHKALLLF